MVAASAAEMMGMIKPSGIGEKKMIAVVDQTNSQTETEKMILRGVEIEWIVIVLKEEIDIPLRDLMTEAESRNVVGEEQVVAMRVIALATLVIEQIVDILKIGTKTESLGESLLDQDTEVVIVAIVTMKATDLEVEISVGPIDLEMAIGPETAIGPEMAKTGVEIVTDSIVTVIGVMAADSGMVTGQISPVTLTGETGSVVTGSVTLLTGERGTAMRKEEIDTMMKKEMTIKLGIVPDMNVRKDVMKTGRERGRLMRLEIADLRKMTGKTEVATTVVKLNVTPGVVIHQKK